MVPKSQSNRIGPGSFNNLEVQLTLKRSPHQQRYTVVKKKSAWFLFKIPSLLYNSIANSYKRLLREIKWKFTFWKEALLYICDMIKGNESDVGNIDFELQVNEVINSYVLHCF